MIKNKSIDTQLIKEMLESKGVRPSYQRLSVLKYILITKNHPSVDTIFKKLAPEIPTLSRTTIYNTLNLLVDKEIITPLTISDREVRYDFMQKPHAHFLCQSCGEVYDIALDSNFPKNGLIDGHIIEEIQVHYRGQCRCCAS